MSFSSDRELNVLVNRYEQSFESRLNGVNNAFRLEQDDWGQELLRELQSLVARIRENVISSYQAERVSAELVQEGERNIEVFFQEINRRLDAIDRFQPRISPSQFIQEVLSRLCPIFPFC